LNPSDDAPDGTKIYRYFAVQTKAMQHYHEKPGGYFTTPRHDLISFLPASNGLRVLEIGAGGCDTLLELKTSGKAAEVAGVELCELPGSAQRHPSIDCLLLGNIEQMSLHFPAAHFDAVLFGDVLEHLIDPWAVIEKVAPLTKKGGVLIASIPNIRSRHAWKQIFIKGQFAYTSHGLFDKTHLRWFCKTDMIALLTPPGFTCISCTSNIELKKNSGTRLFNRWSGRVLEEFLTVQFITVSRREL
jgi:2-polyprenyl-3-methyl-5-hydroxy-6-metoxy-1,4-benzoquinol methylase